MRCGAALVTPIIPDAETMRLHLEHLFGDDLDGCHDGRVELAWRDPQDGALRCAELFGTDQLDELVERAVSINRVLGQNVYIGQALRHADCPRIGRCSDENFHASTSTSMTMSSQQRKPNATIAAVPRRRSS